MSDDGIYVNLYAAGTATVDFRGTKVEADAGDAYPWDGKVEITVEPEKAGRVRHRAADPRLVREKVTSEVEASHQRAAGADSPRKRAIAACRRNWKAGDETRAGTADAGPADRGPPAGEGRRGARGDPARAGGLLLRGGGQRRLGARHRVGEGSEVRGRAAFGPVGRGAHRSRPRRGKAKWSRRCRTTPGTIARRGEMVVWVRQDGKSRQGRDWTIRRGRASSTGRWTRRHSVRASRRRSTTRSRARLRTVRDRTTLGALNDGVEPRDSCDHNIPRFTWWDHRGTKEWVEYEFETPQKLSTAQVYWFDDARIGRHCRAPKAWRLVLQGRGCLEAGAYDVAVRHRDRSVQPSDVRADRDEGGADRGGVERRLGRPGFWSGR